jgi:hypothetical protein
MLPPYAGSMAREKSDSAVSGDVLFQGAPARSGGRAGLCASIFFARRAKKDFRFNPWRGQRAL